VADQHDADDRCAARPAHHLHGHPADAQKGIEVQVPPVEERPAESSPDQITLEIRPGPDYTINGIPVPANELPAQIRGIFAERPRKVLFVKGAEDIVYGDVVRAVDAARGAGIEVVGLVPRGR
jgi:biopolymer transport protein ExbD